MPQTELITLSQLFSHLSAMMDSVADFGSEVGEFGGGEELDTMELSLEGMEFNFDEIRPILETAYEQIKRERFTVVARK